MMDGFVYYANLYPNVYDYRVLALSGMDAIRDSSLFRMTIYTAPSDNNTIAAFDSHLTQIAALPNSWIYGIGAVQTSGSTNWTFRVFDEAGRNLDGGTFRRQPSAEDFSTPNATLPYQLLYEPTFLPDGQLNVEISNQSNAPITVQLLLIVAEPLPALSGLAGQYCA